MTVTRADPGWTGDWALPRALTRRISARDRRTLLAVSMAGVGPTRLARELTACRRIVDLPATVPRGDPEAAEATLRGLGLRAIVPPDREYPRLLREIHAPPLLLYVRGAPLDELAPVVSIVGARICTSGAKRFAAKLAERLAGAGVVIASGLARGIDGAAHRGALSAPGGRTIAVLGTGADIAYPPEHEGLVETICQRGGVVTEFAPGVGPRAWHFPARNRILAGLAHAVVVVEASNRSGALITAGYALDEGRDVFGCTVAPENPAGAGVRELLRDGAQVIVDADDGASKILDALGRPGIVFVPAAPPPRPEPSPESRPVFAAVLEGTTIDDVVAVTGLPADKVATMLAMLELDGWIADDGGGRWRRMS